jgi:hypothetical protein
MAHRFTRAPLAAALAALIAAAPLGAQWQGVVTYQTQGNVADQQMAKQFQYYQGPSGVAKMVVQDKQQGNVSIIYNKSSNTATVVMPARQMYMTMSMNAASAEMQKHMSQMKITPTGKSEVVAGHACQDFHAVDPDDSTESDACIASDMGNFATFSPPQGGNAGSDALSRLQRLFSAKGGGFFPLKATSYKGGKVTNSMVATSIQAQSVAASEFVPPANYKAMSMPGGPQ